jgi:hypothetical protein
MADQKSKIFFNATSLFPTLEPFIRFSKLYYQIYDEDILWELF